MAEAIGLEVRIGGDPSAALGALDKVDSALKHTTSGAQAATSSFLKVGQTIQAWGDALKHVAAVGKRAFDAILGDAIKVADEIGTFSKQTGIATDSLQRLKFAAEQSDASFGTLRAGLKILQRNMGEAASGSKEAADAFARIGLSTSQVASMDVEQVFERIADVMADEAVPDAQKMSLAMDLMGRSASELLPLLKQGGEGIRAFGQEAEELGAVMSDETIQATKDFEDNLKAIKTAIFGASSVILKELAPSLKEWTDAVRKRMPEAIQWVKDFVKAIRIAAENLRYWGEIAGIAVGNVIGGFRDLIKFLGLFGREFVGLLGDILDNAVPLFRSAGAAMVEALKAGLTGKAFDFASVVGGLEPFLGKLSERIATVANAAGEVVETLSSGFESAERRHRQNVERIVEDQEKLRDAFDSTAKAAARMTTLSEEGRGRPKRPESAAFGPERLVGGLVAPGQEIAGAEFVARRKFGSLLEYEQFRERVALAKRFAAGEGSRIEAQALRTKHKLERELGMRLNDEQLKQALELENEVAEERRRIDATTRGQERKAALKELEETRKQAVKALADKMKDEKDKKSLLYKQEREHVDKIGQQRKRIGEEEAADRKRVQDDEMRHLDEVLRKRKEAASSPMGVSAAGPLEATAGVTTGGTGISGLLSAIRECVCRAPEAVASMSGIATVSTVAGGGAVASGVESLLGTVVALLTQVVACVCPRCCPQPFLTTGGGGTTGPISPYAAGGRFAGGGVGGVALAGNLVGGAGALGLALGGGGGLINPFGGFGAANLFGGGAAFGGPAAVGGCPPGTNPDPITGECVPYAAGGGTSVLSLFQSGPLANDPRAPLLAQQIAQKFPGMNPASIAMLVQAILLGGATPPPGITVPQMPAAPQGPMPTPSAGQRELASLAERGLLSMEQIAQIQSGGGGMTMLPGFDPTGGIEAVDRFGKPIAGVGGGAVAAPAFDLSRYVGGLATTGMAEEIFARLTGEAPGAAETPEEANTKATQENTTALRDMAAKLQMIGATGGTATTQGGGQTVVYNDYSTGGDAATKERFRLWREQRWEVQMREAQQGNI